jgi:hypothetical protein
VVSRLVECTKSQKGLVEMASQRRCRAVLYVLPALGIEVMNQQAFAIWYISPIAKKIGGNCLEAQAPGCTKSYRLGLASSNELAILLLFCISNRIIDFFRGLQNQFLDASSRLGPGGTSSTAQRPRVEVTAQTSYSKYFERSLTNQRQETRSIGDEPYGTFCLSRAQDNDPMILYATWHQIVSFGTVT